MAYHLKILLGNEGYDNLSLYTVFYLDGSMSSAISPVHIGLQMGEPTTNCNRIDFFTICSRYVPHITYKKSN